MVYYLELHTIELKKFSADSKEELSEIMSKVKNSLDMWSMFLTRHELLNTDNLPKKLNDNNLKKALGVLEVMNFTSEEREAYEDHLKWLRIEANTLKKAESKGRAAGLEQGIQQGIKQGIEKGIEQGIEKGIELRNQQIAINMLKENVNDKIISSATGLALEKIIKLKGKL
jgi:flagellar biosynthesis/type III secretory pathway protein FliH